MVIDFQIKEQYETYNRTVEEIARSESLDVVAIKSKLLCISEKYRTDIGIVTEEENPNDFSNEDLRVANRTIADNMVSATLPDGSPDYRIRERAAEYIRDDKKGRKEMRQVLGGGNTFNLLSFNDMLEGARKKAEQAKAALQSKTINV